MNTIPEDCPRCAGRLVVTYVAADPEEETQLVNYTCEECFWWIAACEGFSGHQVHWIIDSSNKHAFIVLGNPPASDDGCKGTTGIVG